MLLLSIAARNSLIWVEMDLQVTPVGCVPVPVVYSVEYRRGFGANVQGNMYASMLVMPTAFAALYVAAMFESTAPPYTSRLAMFADR